MKKCLILFSLVFFCLQTCFCLCSCDPSPYNGKDDDLYAIASVTLPGAPGAPGTNTEIEIIETDDHGRRLFRYSGASDTSPTRRIEAYVISQKEEDGRLYYKENGCYILEANRDDFTEEKLFLFKEQNDWNSAEFDETLSWCTEQVSLDFPPTDKAESLILYDFIDSSLSDTLMSIDYICNDADGRLLFFARETIKGDTGDNYRFYAMIIQADGTYNWGSFVELNDFYHHTDQLKELKEKNGWRPQT